MDRREKGTGLVNDEKMCPIDEQNSLVKIVKQKTWKWEKTVLVLKVIFMVIVVDVLVFGALKFK